MTLRLIGLAASPNTRKVLAAAHFLKVPVELETIDYFGGAHKSPSYRALNPNAMIPTLIHGDFVLWESNAIVQYLADVCAGSSLAPSDPRARNDVLRWQFWQCNHWGIACEILATENLLKPVAGEKPDEAEIARGEMLFHRYAAVLDDHLSRHRFLVGEVFTLADVSVATYLEDIPYAKYPLQKYHHISEYWARLCEMECWRETAPDWAALGFS